MSDITQNSTDVDQLITDQLKAGQPMRGKASYCGNPECSSGWHGKPIEREHINPDGTRDIKVLCPGSYNWPERLM